MITEWFLSLVATITAWFLGLFGTTEPPAWMTGIGTFVADLAHRAAGLGAWVPWALFGTISAFVFGLWATFWLVKGVRWLWGLTPFSGGS